MEFCSRHVTDSSSPAEDSCSSMSLSTGNQAIVKPPTAEAPSVPVPLKSIMRAPTLAQKGARTAGKIEGWWKSSQKINVTEQQKVLAAKKTSETSTVVANNAGDSVDTTTKLPVPNTVAQSAANEAKQRSALESTTQESLAVDPAALSIAPFNDTTDQAENSSARIKKRIAAKTVIAAALDLDLVDQLIQEVPFHDNRYSSRVPRKPSSRPPSEVSIPTSTHTPKPPVPTSAKVAPSKNKKGSVASSPAKKAPTTKLKKRSVPATKSEAPPTAETSETKGRKRNPMVWEGIPDEEVAFDIDWNRGWIKRGFERMTGASKAHLDFYWYTPERQYKLRSMKEVERFMNFYVANGNHEEVAWRLLRSK